MKNSLKIAFATLAMVATQATAAPVPAATYNFSYTDGTGGLLFGQVRGTIQADSDSVLVSQLLSVNYNWMPAFALPFLGSGTDYATALSTMSLPTFSGQPILSLSGTRNDFLACNTADCDDGFTFVPAGAVFPVTVYASGDAFGQIMEPYEVTNWSMSAVPEPASWAMLIAGFGLTGATLRRRRMLQAA